MLNHLNLIDQKDFGYFMHSFILLLQVFGDAKTATVGFTVLLIQLLFVILIVIFVIKKAQSHLNLSGLSTASTNEDIFSKAIVAGDLPSEIIVIPSNEKYEVKR